MTHVARRGNRQGRWVDIGYSDAEQADENSHVAPPITEDSYRGGPVSSLENSQASLNKRLASVARLDDSAPTDFNFLFDAAQAKRQHLSAGPCSALGTEGEFSGSFTAFGKDSRQLPPAIVEDGDLRWVRTYVARGADLVDGEAWIAEYQRRLATAKSVDGPSVCRHSTSVGIARGGSGHAGNDFAVRNRVLRELGSVAAPGKKVRLSTGQDVIFWFNVGVPGPPRARVLVTEARCPHQGVCLLKGELMEIEDAAGMRHAMTRCPRHNKTFDLRTGTSEGNSEALKVFPCRFDRGHWYVGVDFSADDSQASSEQAPRTPNIAEVVATLVEPATAEKLPATPGSPVVDSARKRIRCGQILASK